MSCGQGGVLSRGEARPVRPGCTGLLGTAQGSIGGGDIGEHPARAGGRHGWALTPASEPTLTALPLQVGIAAVPRSAAPTSASLPPARSRLAPARPCRGEPHHCDRLASRLAERRAGHVNIGDRGACTGRRQHQKGAGAGGGRARARGAGAGQGRGAGAEAGAEAGVGRLAARDAAARAAARSEAQAGSKCLENVAPPVLLTDTQRAAARREALAGSKCRRMSRLLCY
jgi:hypothetical protein